MKSRHDDMSLATFKGGRRQRLSVLVDCVTQFLDVYGTKRLLGTSFCETTGMGSGSRKFSGLLAASGYPGDPAGFFKHILDSLDTHKGDQISVNGIRLPHLMMVALLEQILPGHGFVDILDVHQLEQVSGIPVPENRKQDLEKVIERYPVRLSRHVIRQMLVSPSLVRQYFPCADELDTKGFSETWAGPFQDGIVEQMYPNRVIFLVNMTCPVYCRFCFRKHKAARNEKNPGIQEVQKAVEYVQKSPLVKEILVTGGDPFLSRINMLAAIDGLMTVAHVQTVRLGTRSIAYYPELFQGNHGYYMEILKQKHDELRHHGKRMEVGTHFIHPDEVTPQSLEIITELVKIGIRVYIQTPFLGGCNDSGIELVKLFSLLQGAGAQPYYIFMPCHPIHGNHVFSTPVMKGLEVAGYLRAHLSDRAVPKVCTATTLGKIDWHTSGWAVERVDGKDDLIWVRTPYSPSYFKSFVSLGEKAYYRINPEGTIDVQLMAGIGNDALFLGSRPPCQSKPARKNNIEMEAPSFRLVSGQVEGSSIVQTGIKGLKRLHETRVEMDVGTGNDAIEYVQKDDRITDVVISSASDPIQSLPQLKHLVHQFRDMDHVTLVRIRSLAFNYLPECYTREVIDTLAGLNCPDIVQPLRLEIETWFITDSEIRMTHEKIAGELNQKGIRLYCNCPLLGGVNDTGDKMSCLAYALRKSGIEFHHLYVAGLGIQNTWNTIYPVAAEDVIDIASAVRRSGSGREIPKYIISTSLGEVDYGLTSSLLKSPEGLKVKLDCYDSFYFKRLDAQFSYPADFEIQKEVPVLRISGLIKSDDFRI